MDSPARMDTMDTTTHNMYWTTMTQFAGMTAGTDYRVGPLFDVDGGWGKHYEVVFTKTGVTALVKQRDGWLDAVKVPSKRGFKLHVCGLTHWTKWGRIRKGAGLMWADRMSWASRDCMYRLASMAVGL